MPKKNLTHTELQVILNNVHTPVSLPVSKPRKVTVKKPSFKKNGRTFTREEDYIHFECIQLLKNEFPHVEFISNVLDGAKLGEKVMKRHAGMRNRPGTSDIIILEPRIKLEGSVRKFYHGMCLEIKTLNGKLSQEQSDFLARLSLKGYYCKWAYGLDHCFLAIREYLQ